MKQPIRIHFVTIAIFMLLFYNQGFGLNLFIMALFIIIINILLHWQKYNLPKITFTAILLSVSYAAFYFGDTVSISLSILGVFLYPVFVHDTNQVSILSVYKASSSLLQNTKLLKNLVFSASENKVHHSGKIIAYVLIPIVVLSLFIAIYSIANATFFEWLQNILLIFDIYFVFYLLIGIIISKYLYHYMQDNFFEIKFPNTFKNTFTSKTIEIMQIEKVEILHTSGKILFSILNGILLIFIVAEFQQIAKIKTEYITAGNSANTILLIFQSTLFSIIAIITSILIAITLLFIYFKKELNFIENKTKIQYLAYTWIFLNAIILFTAGIKVYLSIDFSGYTIKRIGIYGFIILALFGLAYTFIKIYKAKTNFYVVRKMVWIVAIFIGIISPINFSSIITKWNYQLIIQHNKPVEIWRLIKEIDYNYEELVPYLQLQNVSNSDKYSIKLKLQNYQIKNKIRNWQELKYYEWKINKLKLITN